MAKVSIIFDGEEYRLSAATKNGVPLDDARYNIDYLTRLGYRTRIIKRGSYYHVYARKVVRTQMGDVLQTTVGATQVLVGIGAGLALLGAIRGLRK